MKKSTKRGGIAVPIIPIVTEGPLLQNPSAVELAQGQVTPRTIDVLHEPGPGASFRELLMTNPGQEHWEVPG